MPRKKIEDPNDFIAKSDSYPHASNSNSLNVKSSSTFSTLPEDEIIDIQSLNIQQLLTNLETGIKKKPSWFIFMRTREHEKIRLNTEQIRILIEQLQGLRSMHSEYLTFKANVILSKETIQHLIDFKREAFRQCLEQQAEAHKTFLYNQKHDRKQKKIELKKQEAEIDKIVEENNMQRVINKKIEELDAKDTLFVIDKFIGKNKPFETKEDYNDFVKNKEEREHEIKIKDIDLEIAKQKSRKGESETKWEEYRTDQKIDEQKDE